MSEPQRIRLPQFEAMEIDDLLQLIASMKNCAIHRGMDAPLVPERWSGMTGISGSTLHNTMLDLLEAELTIRKN